MSLMTEQGGIIEVQATAEQKALSKQQLDQLLVLAESGIQCLFKKQREALAV